MRVFCNQCGAANDGQPGTKVMCTRCTAVFEVPGAFTPSASAPPPASNPSSDNWVPPWAANPPPAGADASPQAPNPAAGAPASWGTPGAVISPAPGIVRVQMHPLAWISLVLGIMGMACCLIGPVAAIITGAIGISKINANPSVYTGKGLAIAGIILGGAELAFTCLGLVLSFMGQH